MYAYASKLIPPLFMPLAALLLLCLVALILIHRGKTTAGTVLMLSSLVLLCGLSTPYVATGLYYTLERQYPVKKLAEIPKGDCLVLLGGALAAALSPRVDPDMGEAVDRLYKAAQLYKNHKATLVVVSGGNQPWAEPGPSEGELIKNILVEWEVPESAIVVESQSRNTHENASYSAPILQKENCTRTLLVTSAAHMPRAVAAFQVLGIDSIPVSTDIRVVDSRKLAAMDFFPDAHALAMTSDAIREYMGLVVYKLRGWN